METGSAHPPVIIIGMHRSGTSMVSKMLEEVGLFLGRKKDINNEAYLFLKLNDWILWQCGTSWDNPNPVQYIIDTKNIRMLVTDYIQYVLKSPWAISYLGIRRYIRYHGMQRIDIPWGWKDPRNTILLPIWLDIFPNAKVIHVHRNGIDVASSLQRRSEKAYQRKLRFYRYLKRWYWFIKKRKFFVDSPRCLNIEKGVGLWDRYMKQARFFLSNSKIDFIEIKYEKILEAPEETVQTLSAFCGLPGEKEMIKKAVSTIRPKRTMANHEQETLNELASKYAACLREHGY